ncbi:alkene reductase [Scytonema hofmannii PCC 7110]|uniref:Alkene reductase n=1 Tax=Scytonema hofmannii PCC 7110 TaxID=128403 RepID=A0A139X039_9CYAN|nr:alkene reductase [Scytonema hofmannii]KYC38069.1 alkene reductase [Scytonema hofmannii PCC 7110]
MSSDTNLFSSFQLGSLTLPNRIVMAPMTRLRAGDGGVPISANATYYSQRASAGLIITECTMISPQSQGYLNCPGIYSPQQVEGWRVVTNAVHEKGGRIFLQLWHCGRISHPALQAHGELPVSPSAIPAEGQLHTPNGKQSMIAPHALEIKEIQEIIQDFHKAAENARTAEFDGVELHGAFGYLIDQFLQDGSNHRTDEYGGSIENRAKFLLEVVEAVASVWGGNRVGIKFSPSNTYYSMVDSDPKTTFSYTIDALNRFDLAYIHLMEPEAKDLATREVLHPVASIFRPIYNGTLIANGGFTKESGNKILAEGNADLVSFGKSFLANPDLPKRFELDAPLNSPNSKTFYGQGSHQPEVGYTDYPFFDRAA